MSFFRRRSFSLRRNNSRQARNKDATTQADVSQDQGDPESPTRYSSFENIDGDQMRDEHKLPLLNYVQAPRDIDSRLYIVINVPAWEGCIVQYPTSSQVAALMSKLQSNLSNWTITLEVKKIDHFFIHGDDSITHSDDLEDFQPVMRIQVYHQNRLDKEGNIAALIHNIVQNSIDPEKKCSIEIWTDGYHMNT